MAHDFPWGKLKAEDGPRGRPRRSNSVPRRRVRSFDVPTAFLRGFPLGRTVHVTIPGELQRLGGFKSKVVRLHRAAYGLADAPKAFFLKFKDSLTRLGFQQVPGEAALFVLPRKNGAGCEAVIAVHVDDAFFACSEATYPVLQGLCEEYGITSPIPLMR